jgi:protein arginine kinase activator
VLCNVCGKGEATIHVTEIVNNQMVELHLCETCAHEKGGDVKAQFSFNNLLAGLADFTSLLSGEKKEDLTCDYCGMTYEDFGKTGRLGCSDCYTSFSKALIPLIKRVQRGTQHVGKRPERIPQEMKSTLDLRDLQERLRKSVQQEEFEEAARIRDQIKQLEAKFKKGSAKRSPKS